MNRQIDKISLFEFKTMCQELQDKDRNQLEILAFEMGLSKDEIEDAPLDELCKRIATNTVMAPIIIIPEEAENYPEEMFKLICDKFHEDYFLDEAYKWAKKAKINGIRDTMGKKELCNLLQPVTVLTPDEQRKMTEQGETDSTIKRAALSKVREAEEAARLKRIEENRENKEKGSKNVSPLVNVSQSHTRMITQPGQKATSITVRPPVRKSMSERERINYLCEVLGNESLEDLKKIAKSKGLQDAEYMNKAMICRYLAKETYLEWLPEDILSMVKKYKGPETLDEVLELVEKHYSLYYKKVFRYLYDRQIAIENLYLYRKKSLDKWGNYTLITSFRTEEEWRWYAEKFPIMDDSINDTSLTSFYHGIRHDAISRYNHMAFIDGRLDVSDLKDYLEKWSSEHNFSNSVQFGLINIINEETLTMKYSTEYSQKYYLMTFKRLPIHPHLPIIWEFMVTRTKD